MAVDSPFTALLVRAPRASVEQALARALADAGYVGAPGLRSTTVELDLDPHLRHERAFRLKELGDWVAICELGAESAADYFLVSALLEAGIERAAYVALAGSPPGGVVALQVEGEAPLELWLEAGIPDMELSGLLAPGTAPPPDAVDTAWAIAQLAALDDQAGAILAGRLASGGSPSFDHAGGETLPFVRRD